MSHQADPSVLIWCDTTLRQPFETGIQRVTRRLARALSTLGVEATPVGWDARRRLMTSLSSVPVAASGRGWLLVPEIPETALIAGVDLMQVGRALGRSTAMIVHDLIPLKRSFDYPEDTVVAFRRYCRMFAGADLVFATTQTVAQDLRTFLSGEGLPSPAIRVLPLPAQFGTTARVSDGAPVRTAAEPLRLLTVSTWEPRKNHSRFLRALGAAKAAGARIEATVVGRRDCFPEYDREILALAAGIPGVNVAASMNDDRLESLYSTHHASVYPSIEEGFGLPVLESLWLGRPCVCHFGSAMAETAPGGGTVMIDMENERAIAEVLVRLSHDIDVLERLNIEARERPLRSWLDYGEGVADALHAASRRAA